MLSLPFSAPENFTRLREEDPLDLNGAEWIVARDRELLVSLENGSSWPRGRLPMDFKVIQPLGKLGDSPFVAAAAAPGTEPPPGWTWVGLRALFGTLDYDRLSLAGRAVQLLDWELNHAFCGRCGRPTAIDRREGCRKCADCGLVSFPRIEPSIIVAVVRDGKEILLARSARAKLGFHSVLAGFVEAGESLEQCVEREVFEEVGIRIKNLRYVTSQPWPFPRSLMVGFVAEYASGSITVDPVEIESAAWFPMDQMPLIPSTVSISRALIDLVLSGAVSLNG